VERAYHISIVDVHFHTDTFEYFHMSQEVNNRMQLSSRYRLGEDGLDATVDTAEHLAFGR
jgi:hypothetical protein